MINNDVKGAFLILRVPKDFKSKIENMAQDQEVSVSELIRGILSEEIK